MGYGKMTHTLLSTNIVQSSICNFKKSTLSPKIFLAISLHTLWIGLCTYILEYTIHVISKLLFFVNNSSATSILTRVFTSISSHGFNQVITFSKNFYIAHRAMTLFWIILQFLPLFILFSNKLPPYTIAL